MISANLAQNRVRLIHEVDLYTDIYGRSGWMYVFLNHNGLTQVARGGGGGYSL